MDLGASSGLLPVGECSAEMRSSPMSEEFSVGPWSCEGAGHCTGGRCSGLGRGGFHLLLCAPILLRLPHRSFQFCTSPGFVQWPVPVTQGQWCSENTPGKHPREEQFISL